MVVATVLRHVAPFRAWLALLAAVLLLSGCAGYRSGDGSVAYLGGREADDWGVLPVDGATLTLRLDNQIQRDDLHLMLFIVPVMYDPVDKPRFDAARGTRLQITIRPETGDFRFRPNEAVLVVDGRRLTPDKATLLVVFDPGQYPLPDAPDIGPVPAGTELHLAKPQRNWQFVLVFPGPVPNPSSDIRLDLSRALDRAGKPTIPEIRFRSRPWRQGYT